MNSILKQTANGQLTYSTELRKYSVEFGTVFFQLDEEEYSQFEVYLNDIDFEYYLRLNVNAKNKRKIIVSLYPKGMAICLHKNEFIELRNLLSRNNIQSKELVMAKLDFNIIYN